MALNRDVDLFRNVTMLSREKLRESYSLGHPPWLQLNNSPLNGCVSWECLWRSEWWPHHWFAVLLSPWPDLDQKNTHPHKACFRPLTSSLLGNVIASKKTSPWQTLERLYSGVLVALESPCIHSPAVTRELVVCIFKRKVFYMPCHTPFATF